LWLLFRSHVIPDLVKLNTFPFFFPHFARGSVSKLIPFPHCSSIFGFFWGGCFSSPTGNPKNHGFPVRQLGPFGALAFLLGAARTQETGPVHSFLEGCLCFCKVLTTSAWAGGFPPSRRAAFCPPLELPGLA